MISVRPARRRTTDRVATETDKTPDGKINSIPAPIHGMIDNDSLSVQRPLSARVIENMFVTQSGVRVRGGRYKVAMLGAPVTSVFSYESATLSQMFATTDTDIYNISALDPAAVPASDVTGQTSGRYSTAQLGTVGGEYLYAVNGTEKAQLYDGTTWTAVDGVSTPAITGVTTSNLNYVWTFKSRYWFVEKNSKVAWYLPVDSIGGAAADFSLKGIFQDGGYLMFGATWSQDSGDGMDDRIVFVSSLGEVAVYEGSNPADAATWGLVGLYKMSPPLGPNAHVRAGGDVIIATEEGLIPISAVVQKDPAALALAAVSAPIENTWQKYSRSYIGTQPWEIVKWPRENMLMVSLPSDGNTGLVANVNTGAWSVYTGWDIQCLTIHSKTCYFGSADGFIYQAERGGDDDGTPFVAKLSGYPTGFGSTATHKTVNSARATFLSALEFNPQVSFSTNYNVDFPAAPTAAAQPTTTAALWDVGKWDVSLWDDSQTGEYSVRPIYTTNWVSQGKVGFVVSPQIQITSSGERRPDAELVSIEVLYSEGGAVV